LGIPVAKSAALSFVSWQPLSFLNAALVLLAADAGPGPSKQLALAP
jgi:hypothetical protein